MPVKQFWALTVYNRDTLSFIYSDKSFKLPDLQRVLISLDVNQA